MYGQRSLPLLITPLLALAFPQSAPPPAPHIVVTPFHITGDYSLGERAGWNVRVDPGVTGLAHYTIKKNNQDVVKSGDIDLATGGTIEVTLNESAMLYMELTPPSGKSSIFGAAVAPTMLRPVVPKPRDFDAFWKRKIAEMRAIPADPVLTPGDSGKPDVEYATIRMNHVNGTHVYGQIAKPKKPGKYPALLILQWASPPYRLWNPWVTDRAAQGWLAMNIEPHDVLPTEPQSYYDALPAPLKNYQTINWTDREKSYFVEMYLRDVRAVDYLASRPDWDGKTIVVMGTSMGGQQALAVAGLHPKVTHVIVDEPAGCDLNASLHGRQMGYPFFPASDPKVMETARYVDAINFASNIKATSLVAMGYVDNIAPPAGIWTAFNQIRGPKVAVPMPDSPHNNLATNAQQAPYTTMSADWLSRLVKGEKPTILKDR